MQHRDGVCKLDHVFVGCFGEQDAAHGGRWVLERMQQDLVQCRRFYDVLWHIDWWVLCWPLLVAGFWGEMTNNF